MRQPKRVFGYARVSSFEQGERGTSLDGQREDLVRYCTASKWPAPEMHVEIESGGAEKIERRTELKRLIAAAKSGDVVLVCKTDRWSRDIPYAVSSVRALVARGVGWISVGESIDASTQNGDSMLGIMAWAADQERRRIRERTVGTRQRLRAQGKAVEGPAPFGYTFDRVTRTLIIDEPKAAIVREMFRLAIEGHSTREISALYPDQPGFDGGGVGRKLRHRAYVGMLRTVGSHTRKPSDEDTWIKAHDPIVDIFTFRRAGESLKKRYMVGRKGDEDSRTASFLARGLIHCGDCGYLMRSQVTPENTSCKHLGWYACRQVRGQQMGKERCVRGALARHDETDALIETMMLEHLGTLADELARPPAPAESRPQPVDLERRRATLLSRQKRVVDSLSSGVLAPAQAKATLDEITEAINVLDLAREKQEAEEAIGVKSATDRRKELVVVRKLARAWSGLTIAEKRTILATHADDIKLWPTPAARWARKAWRLEIEWRKTT